MPPVLAPDHQEYPAVCTSCGERQAWPFRVSSAPEAENLRVELRCKACRKEFDQALPRPRMVDVTVETLLERKTKSA